MSTASVREFLQARPIGSAMWIRVHGRSMYPLLRSGDSLRVLRCEAAALRRGDVAIALRPDGVLVAHLVDGVAPLVLTSFLGARDPEGTRVLGRAIAVRTRAGLRIPLPGVSRAALLAGSRAARWAAASGPARSLVRTAREVIATARGRFDGRPDVRVLQPADVDAAYLFVQDRVSAEFEAFVRAVVSGRVVGVYVRGELRALRVPGVDGPRLIHDRTGAGAKYGALAREFVSSAR